tara:strand:- start:685 stop:1371 length:687 start_codon:yes stop_codon:yes gene_type:complete
MLVQQNQNIKGFTLLELLVVLAIVAIVSAVGYPSFDTWVSKNRVKSEADKIAGLFSSATTQVERGMYAYVLIEFESGKFPTVITARGVSQSDLVKRLRQDPPIKCDTSDFTGLWTEINTHTMHEDTYIDTLAKKSIGGSGATICFSKGGTYFKSNTGLGNKFFDGETAVGKETSNFITICHNNSSDCDTLNGAFDTEKKYTAYLVRYSRFGLITKYKWSFKKNDWINY